MKRHLILALVAAIGLGALSACARQGYDPERDDADFGKGFFEVDEDLKDMTKEDKAGGETSHETIEPGARVDTIEKQTTATRLSFPQTKWNECVDKVTGNYETYQCVSRRDISVILDSYLQERLISCVDSGLAAQGGGTSRRLHITHAGITADARHSPRSLHSVNRAIDIKIIQVELYGGSTKTFTYSKLGNRPFYTALRDCWGRTVSRHNGCPLYADNPKLTGSIGWENADHGRHMHLSVPYCLSGAYGSGLWVR